MDIRALNERRTRCAARCASLGRMNMPSDPDERLAADAAYKLAQDAWLKAEQEYQRAISTLSAEEMKRLAMPQKSGSKNEAR